jgi:plasmid stability protein
MNSVRHASSRTSRLGVLTTAGHGTVNGQRYQVDTMTGMAMTLRLTDDEQAALQARAKAEGISMQDAARRAVREFVSRGEHRDRVTSAAELVITRHADALRRLGE